MNSHDDTQPTPGEPAGATQPAAEAPLPPPGPRPSNGFFGWVRSLNIVRGQDRWIGGVASGVAARTGLDPILVRGLFVVLAIFGGIGLLAYGLAWALLPEPDGRIHTEEAGRGNWTSGMTGALGVSILGLWRPNLPFFGNTGGLGGFFWSLFWIGVAVFAVYWITNNANRKKSDDGSTPVPGGEAPTPYPPAPYSPAPYKPTQSATAQSSPAPYSPTQSTTGLDAETLPPSQPSSSSPSSSSSSSTSAHTVPLAWDQRTPATQPMQHSFHPRTHTEAQRPATTTPCTPPVPRPSGADIAVFFGGAVLLAGLVLALDYLGVLQLGDSAIPAALATGVVVLGIGIVLLGLRGRCSGVLGFLATVGIIGGLLSSASLTTGHWVVASQGLWSSSTGVSAESGYTVVAGQGRIDLTDLDDLQDDISIPIHAAAGNVGVLIPEGVPVEVRSMVALSSTELVTSVDTSSLGGIWQPGTLHLNENADGPRIILDVRGVVSHITVSTNESALEDAESGQEP